MFIQEINKSCSYEIVRNLSICDESLLSAPFYASALVMVV